MRNTVEQSKPRPKFGTASCSEIVETTASTFVRQLKIRHGRAVVGVFRRLALTVSSPQAVQSVRAVNSYAPSSSPVLNAQPSVYYCFRKVPIFSDHGIEENVLTNRSQTIYTVDNFTTNYIWFDRNSSVRPYIRLRLSPPEAYFPLYLQCEDNSTSLKHQRYGHFTRKNSCSRGWHIRDRVCSSPRVPSIPSKNSYHRLQLSWEGRQGHSEAEGAQPIRRGEGRGSGREELWVCKAVHHRSGCGGPHCVVKRWQSWKVAVWLDGWHCWEGSRCVLTILARASVCQIDFDDVSRQLRLRFGSGVHSFSHSMQSSTQEDPWHSHQVISL